jgi:DNA-binding NarL/FixJ family response regulator
MNILIADQNPGFRQAIRWLLQGGDVEEVWEAADGEEAVALTRELRPDLVLMEMTLPRVSGLEATEMIKKTEKNVRVVIMAEQTEPVYRRAALCSGADAFIPKVSAWASLVPEALVPWRRAAGRADAS